jgi:hypothetical protein
LAVLEAGTAVETIRDAGGFISVSRLLMASRELEQTTTTSDAEQWFHASCNDAL